MVVQKRLRLLEAFVGGADIVRFPFLLGRPRKLCEEVKLKADEVVLDVWVSGGKEPGIPISIADREQFLLEQRPRVGEVDAFPGVGLERARTNENAHIFMLQGSEPFGFIEGIERGVICDEDGFRRFVSH